MRQNLCIELRVKGTWPTRLAPVWRMEMLINAKAPELYSMTFVWCV